MMRFGPNLRISRSLRSERAYADEQRARHRKPWEITGTDPADREPAGTG